ncbi:helicase-related protein [Desulfobacula sp.]|uniref:helicase-related protein n=1 Tax=Desulfobacula sp. TaxID=2593537 RepID=UPI00262633E3|nr:helicase-related protein [Desulfobacula sp.]
MNSSDLTFFTNDNGQTLLDRFKATLDDTQLFDVLVGYFRSSGFYQLYESIENIDKTRILVGLGLDSNAYQTIQTYQNQSVLDFNSHYKVKKQFQNDLINEVENTTDQDEKLEMGLRKFIEFLKSDCKNKELDIQNGGNGKKLEIRAYPSKNIHAKVYIGRFEPDDRDYGFVITGSSNFSYSGLVANREFNVELRQRRDVEFALDQFETLWSQSVDISEEFVDTVQNKTWLNNQITPYELYLKLIYEYMQEDINLTDEIDTFLPDGFMNLQYQQQAVVQALKKLEEYNGVFLSDVVGLGKTFIAAQLLQQLKGRILVICPPMIKSYWEESLHDFRVPAKVESLGKLDRIIQFGLDRFNYIVVDEAHRFRNEATQSYADLLDICRGKKVILVTATPMNNTIDDIFAQLKLFQSPKRSTIPGIRNLEKYFNSLRKRFKHIDKKDSEYQQTILEVSEEIRGKILKHVMVRRTRSDVTTFFNEDVENQGLKFPEMQDPVKIIYEFEGQLEFIFNETITLLALFRYSRYTPLLYYEGKKRLSEFEKQQQKNVGGFMKGILIKRLESSFYAFKKTLGRFTDSYKKFIEMFEKGTVYISKKVDVYDLLDNDDLEKLNNFIEQEKVLKYLAEDFNPIFYKDLQHDLMLLNRLLELWGPVEHDPKIQSLIHSLENDKILKKKKLILFTESRETADYLHEKLSQIFLNKVLSFSSKGGYFQDDNSFLSPAIAKDIIKANYDPNQKNSQNNIQILITTDVLSEGINLHRSNILINYDLPWNPTRVLQRSGRVNRLGSLHSKIFIFNFFPTTQSDAHLGLEANITNKIQMFHHILGEDARYLSDGEEIGSQELFDSLTRKNTYTGEMEPVDSELKYLKMMRELRDKDPALFERVKKLPKKARSGAIGENLSANQLITFFRLGKLKKFYLNTGKRSREITFFDAAGIAECSPDTKRQSIPEDYYKLLEINKLCFEQDTLQEIEPDLQKKGGRSNVDYIETRLRERNFKQCKKFTDSDEEFLEGIKRMIRQGTLAKKTAMTIKRAFEKTLDPLVMLKILRKHIRVVDSESSISQQPHQYKKEIILSAYQVKAGNQ